MAPLLRLPLPCSWLPAPVNRLRSRCGHAGIWHSWPPCRAEFSRWKSAVDEIFIEGLRIDCVIGVYDHERDVPQPLQFDLRLRFDAEDRKSTRLNSSH